MKILVHGKTVVEVKRTREYRDREKICIFKTLDGASFALKFNEYEIIEL